MKTLRCLAMGLVVSAMACGNVMAEEMSWHAAGSGGAVAAGGEGAVAAGITILKQGGNAADSAAATLLALAATDVGYFVIGAEVPFIIYDAQRKEVKVLSGLGGAPLAPEAMDWYYENGIPQRRNMKRAPVPAGLSCCVAAVKHFGTMSFEQIIAPTLAILDDFTLIGDSLSTRERDWFPNLAKTYRKMIETERKTKGTREEKLQAARDRFYKGDIADDLAAFYKSQGGFLTKVDLAAHRTRIEDPVTVNYRGYTVCKAGPWTQGPYLCQTLRLLEGFNLKKMGHMSADYIHVLTEALKLGFADRDEYYGDPLFVDVPLARLLSDEYTEMRRKLIDMDHASDTMRPGDPINMKAVIKPRYKRKSIGGTTTCIVADKWGNMVSATPSGNPNYYVDPVTGVPHGNRLCQLNTTPGHPDRIEPGKRPRITLTPTLVLDENGEPVIGISVAGGDLQDQTALICLLNYIEFGIMPSYSVMAPRFSTGHHQGTFDPNPNREETLGRLSGLAIEDRVPDDVVADLKKRGHKIRRFDGANSHPIMMVVDRETGLMYAAGDHRVKRHAAVVKSSLAP